MGADGNSHLESASLNAAGNIPSAAAAAGNNTTRWLNQTFFGELVRVEQGPGISPRKSKNRIAAFPSTRALTHPCLEGWGGARTALVNPSRC